MNFEQAINDDRAVSPVIGVILMVAITVILAAVIGTFVLGMSDQMGDSTPRASFGMTAGNSDTQVTITHETGDTIDADHLSIKSTQSFTGDDNPTWQALDADAGANFEVSAGASLTITEDDGGDFVGDTVRVIYQNPDSDSSTTLQKKTFN